MTEPAKPRPTPARADGSRVRAALALVVTLALSAPTGLAADAPPGRERNTLALTGQLLVASPDIIDPRFHQTVIYMITHRPDGASGFIVNKAFGEAPIAEFLERFDIELAGAEGTVRFHYGGPVEPASGFVLHTGDYRGPATRVIDERISLTTDMEVLKAIAQGRGPRRSLVALGYSGWGAGQLDAEIAAGNWLSAPADEDLIFDDDDATKWKRASAKAGHKL